MAAEIHLRLYEELNSFLPPERRKRRFAWPVKGINTVEEMLASLGVPGDQVELVLVNGNSVDFSHHIKAGDFVSVYPVFESFDIKPLLRVRSRPLRRTRFIVMPDLLQLARYLRALGYSALDAGSWTIEKIIRVAEEEKRILLTKNFIPAQFAALSRVYPVQASRPGKQLAEVLSRLDLMDSKQLFRLRSFFAGIIK